MKPILFQWSIWHYTSPSSGETAVIAKKSYPGDYRFQHEYQRILKVVEAYTAEEAIMLFKESTK